MLRALMTKKKNFWATQEILRILRNMEVHYRVCRNPSYVFMLSQTNIVYDPFLFLKYSV